MAQKVLFDDNGVRVTSRRVVANGTTFPVAQIGSVRIAPVRSGPLVVPILQSLLGLSLMALFWGYLLGGCGDAPQARGFGWAGLAAFALALMYFRNKAPMHTVLISVGGAEHAVAASPNLEWANEVADAINTAVLDVR